MASELKSVLDSWVRYEQQVKEREQAELTKAVIDKVLASIKEDKVQKEILQNAVAEVERTSWVSKFRMRLLIPIFFYRARKKQGYLDAVLSVIRYNK